MTRTASKFVLLGMLLAGLTLATSAHARDRSSIGFTYVDRDSGFAIHLGDGGGYHYDTHYSPRYYRDRHHRHTRYCDHRYDRHYRHDRRHARHYRHHNRHYRHDRRHYRHDRYDRRYDRRYRRHH